MGAGESQAPATHNKDDNVENLNYNFEPLASPASGISILPKRQGKKVKNRCGKFGSRTAMPMAPGRPQNQNAVVSELLGPNTNALDHAEQPPPKRQQHVPHLVQATVEHVQLLITGILDMERWESWIPQMVSGQMWEARDASLFEQDDVHLLMLRCYGGEVAVKTQVIQNMMWAIQLAAKVAR